MIGALSCSGLLDRMCFRGALDGTVSACYVENFSLTLPIPGKAVIMDSASPHKNEEALDLIEGSGTQILFLPPYCPLISGIDQLENGGNLFSALRDAISIQPENAIKRGISSGLTDGFFFRFTVISRKFS